MRLLLSTLLSVLFCSVAIAESTEDSDLLLQSSLKKLKTASVVRARFIMRERERDPAANFVYPRAMHFHPMNSPHISFNLESEDLSRLLEYLTASDPISFEDRVSSCTYQPGVAFDFYLDNHPVPNSTVLLCLNCDLWAIQTPGAFLHSTRAPDPSRLLFLDSRPYRESLLQFREKLEKIDAKKYPITESNAMLQSLLQIRKKRETIDAKKVKGPAEEHVRSGDKSPTAKEYKPTFVEKKSITDSNEMLIQKIEIVRTRKAEALRGQTTLYGNGFAIVNEGTAAYFWKSSTPPHIKIRLPSSLLATNNECMLGFHGLIPENMLLAIEGLGTFKGGRTSHGFQGEFELAEIHSCAFAES